MPESSIIPGIGEIRAARPSAVGRPDEVATNKAGRYTDREVREAPASSSISSLTSPRGSASKRSWWLT